MLALGTGARSDNPADSPDDPGLSDAIHVIAVNSALGAATILDIPRDTEGPGGSKLNFYIVSSGSENLRVIALTANPSTGYSWAAGKNDKVKYVSSKQVNASGNAVGAAGTQQLKFKAADSGTTTLELAYSRPFEGGVPPAQTASFDVTIKS